MCLSGQGAGEAEVLAILGCLGTEAEKGLGPQSKPAADT